MKFNRWVLLAHPFLLTAFPILSLYTHNLVEVPFSQVWTSLWISLTAAGLLFLLLWGLSRSREKAALVTSLLSVAFFSFGHTYSTTQTSFLRGSVLGMADVQLAIWAAALILVGWWLLRKLRNPLPLTYMFCVVGAASFLAALFPLGTHAARLAAADDLALEQPADLHPALAETSSRPDIYYIILDGYGRDDVLSELYGLDNSDFIQFLQGRGFYLAGESYTNYARTMHSLSSSLNFHYLDDLIEADPSLNDYSLYRRLIKDNAVQQALREQGYRTVALSTGFELTEMDSADLFLRGVNPINHFEEMLLARSMAIFWLDQVVGDYRRVEIHNAFNELAGTVELEGPKFVFAHLIVPHPPFVFGKNGEPIEPRGWGDGTSYAGGVEHYLEHYPRQLQYVNQMVAELVVTLQEDSPTQPVIILQADHGPGAVYDWLDWQKSCLRERMPILNAYFFPDGGQNPVPADITPVNTFRVVLNRYFGADLPLLENRMYTVENLYRPYDLVEITDSLDQCPLFGSEAGGALP